MHGKSAHFPGFPEVRCGCWLPSALVFGAIIGPATGWLLDFLMPDNSADGVQRFVQIVVAAAVVGGMLAAWLIRFAGEFFSAKITRPFHALALLGRREFFLPDYYFLGVALPFGAGSLLCRFVDWFVIDRILIGTFARLPVRYR